VTALIAPLSDGRYRRDPRSDCRVSQQEPWPERRMSIENDPKDEPFKDLEKTPVDPAVAENVKGGALIDAPDTRIGTTSDSTISPNLNSTTLSPNAISTTR
jgi:hypothetical protein